MLWRDVVNLVKTDMIPNKEDIPTDTEISRKDNIIANKLSIRQTEFYLALNQNIKLEQTFEVRTSEYGNENKVEYNGNEYNIERTYSKNDEIIQLICSLSR